MPDVDAIGPLPDIYWPSPPEDLTGLGFGSILEYSENLTVNINFQIEDSTIKVEDIPLMLKKTLHES